jgi:hypothetical protein
MTRSRHIHDVLAEEALVLALEGLGCVPVEDGDEWLQPYHEIRNKRLCRCVIVDDGLIIYYIHSKLHDGWQG